MSSLVELGSSYESSCGCRGFSKSVKVTKSFNAADNNNVFEEPTLLYMKALTKLPDIRVSKNNARRSLKRLLVASNFGSITKSTYATVAIAVVISCIRIGRMEATYTPDENASSVIGPKA